MLNWSAETNAASLSSRLRRSGCCGRSERLHRNTFLQELEAGEDDAIPRLQAGADRVEIAIGVAQGDCDLVSEVTTAPLRSHVDEGLAVDADHGEDGDG